MLNTSKPRRVVIYIGLTLWMLVNLFPIYWLFTFSLKSNAEIFGSNVAGLPQHWLWSNYATALKTGKMGFYFLNSVAVFIYSEVGKIFIQRMSYSKRENSLQIRLKQKHHLSFLHCLMNPKITIRLVLV